MPNFWTALLPIAGVIVGILLQSFLSRSNSNKDTDSQRRHDVYSTYLEAVSNRDIPSLTKAKAKITIIGSSEVIKAISKFELNKPVLDNKDSIENFLGIVKAMRRETSFGKQGLKNDEIYSVLFGDNRFSQ